MGDLNKKAIGNLSDPKLPYDYINRPYGTVPMDTTRPPFQWVSDVAYKNVHRIVTRGYDTTELMEQGYGLIDVLFINFQGQDHDVIQHLLFFNQRDPALKVYKQYVY